MLWIKAFHIVFVISWFAGLFYLPRIFVNLAMVPADSPAERERLLLMARKLFRFVTPLGVLAIGLGFWLWFGYGFGGGWLHAKTALVAGLVAYHVWCGGAARRPCRRSLGEVACVVPLLQRSAGAGAGRHLHPRRGQAVLGADRGRHRLSKDPPSRKLCLEPLFHHLPARSRSAACRRPRRCRRQGYCARSGRRRLHRQPGNRLSHQSRIAHRDPGLVAHRQRQLSQRSRNLPPGLRRRLVAAVLGGSFDSRLCHRDPLAAEEPRIHHAEGQGRGLRPLSRRHGTPPQRQHEKSRSAHSPLPHRPAGDALSRYLGRAALHARPQTGQGRCAAQGKPCRRHPAPLRLATRYAAARSDVRQRHVSAGSSADQPRRRAGAVARAGRLRFRALEVFRCRTVAQAAARSGRTSPRSGRPAAVRQRP